MILRIGTPSNKRIQIDLADTRRLILGVHERREMRIDCAITALLLLAVVAHGEVILKEVTSLDHRDGDSTFVVTRVDALGSRKHRVTVEVRGPTVQGARCEIKANDPGETKTIYWAYCGTNTLKKISVSSKVNAPGSTGISFDLWKHELMRCVLKVDVERKGYGGDTYAVPVGILQAESKRKREQQPAP